jgi:hypothetical protein
MMLSDQPPAHTPAYQQRTSRCVASTRGPSRAHEGENKRAVKRKEERCDRSRDTEFGTGFIRRKSPAGCRVARARQSQTVTNDLSASQLFAALSLTAPL